MRASLSFICIVSLIFLLGGLAKGQEQTGTTFIATSITNTTPTTTSTVSQVPSKNNQTNFILKYSSTWTLINEYKEVFYYYSKKNITNNNRNHISKHKYR